MPLCWYSITLENRVPLPTAAAEAAGVLSAASRRTADRVLVIPYVRGQHGQRNLHGDAGTVLPTDNDVGGPDGVIDPGDVVSTTVTINNNSTTPTPVAATGVEFAEILDGMTIVNQPGADINVSPIAFDESHVVGNTTFVVSAAGGILNGSTATHVTLGADVEFFTNTTGANAATQAHIVTTGVIESVTLNADGSWAANHRLNAEPRFWLVCRKSDPTRMKKPRRSGAKGWNGRT